MKRKTKRLWKLYKELRMLRRVNTEIVRDCNEANDRLAAAETAVLQLRNYIRELEQKRRGSIVAFAIPKETVYVHGAIPMQISREPVIPPDYKVKWFNELLAKGHMKKVETDLYVEYRLLIAEEQNGID